MADSNQFHAVALDTEPPIFYMNDVRAIAALEYNRRGAERRHLHFERHCQFVTLAVLIKQTNIELLKLISFDTIATAQSKVSHQPTD